MEVYTSNTMLPLPGHSGARPANGVFQSAGFTLHLNPQKLHIPDNSRDTGNSPALPPPWFCLSVEFRLTPPRARLNGNVLGREGEWEGLRQLLTPELLSSFCYFLVNSKAVPACGWKWVSGLLGKGENGQNTAVGSGKGRFQRGN